MSQLDLMLAIVSPVFAAGGAFMATRVTLKWHERLLRMHDKRIASLEHWRLQK